jgi:hypothetical protein
MKGLKLKWPSPGRLRRTVLTVGAAGACVGGMLFIAAPAQAVVGTDPTLGTIVLSPTSGSSSTTTTWSTTDGCPSGFQTSAGLYEVDYGSTSSPPLVTEVSGTVNLSGGAAIPAGQALAEDVPDALAAAGVPVGGTDEWVVKCSSVSGSLGVIGSTGVYYQDIDVTLDTATTYSVSTPKPAVGTTTTLSANPTSETASSTSEVQLTATITAADGTDADGGGTVTFYNGGTAINSTPAPVTWSTSSPITGSATTETTFSAASTYTLTATFTPSNTTAYNSSTSAALMYTVYASGTQSAGSVPVSVTVPTSGTFTVTIPTTTATLAPNSAVTQATGSLGTVTVTETRNTEPGWAVYGQETENFSAPGVTTTIPSDDLGWTPTGTVEGGATLGPSAGDIGESAGPAILAQALAGSGFGTDSLDPTLQLTLPAGTPPGTYTGALTITYIESAP